MIIDKIKNASNYYAISKNLEIALKKMESTDFSNIEEGKYEIDGNKVFMLVQKYNTKDEKDSRWEAHFKYIDIQYIYEGKELIKYSYINDLKQVECDKEKDICFLEGDGDFLTLSSGTFAIFLPDDAHKPCVSVNNNSSQVKKIVFKVLI